MELAWLLAFRSEECARRAARTRALTALGPNGGAIFDIVPTEADSYAPFLGSSDARQVFNVCRTDYGD